VVPANATRAWRSLVLLASLLVATALVGGGPSADAGGAAVTTPDLVIEVPTNLISIGIDPNTGTRQLRFTHITADIGTGPFEIEPTYNSSAGTATFVQVIYKSPRPGVWVRDHTVPVAQGGAWHPPSDYQFPLTRFTLDAINADGSPGQVVATSPKADYCITGDYRLSGVPNTPDQTYPSPSNCTDPTRPLGWSVGWGDQYDQTDAGQPIDLSGVPDGAYVLHAMVDPQHVLTESNTTNDVTDTRLQVSGDTVTVLSQTTPAVTPPAVRLRAPAAHAHISGQVTLSAATSSAPPATVASVQFLLDGQPLGGPVTTRPYRYTWRIGSTVVGNHTLSARVTDSEGNLATAAAVPVVVIRAPGLPALKVRSLRWSHGLFRLVASGLPANATLAVELDFPHHPARRFTASDGRLRVRTARPPVVVLRILVGGQLLGRPIMVHLGRPPVVRITNPVAGEIVSGTVPIAATATDELAVSSVQFSIDGRPLGRPLGPPPYVIHWSTRGVKPGRHRIAAVATNPGGESGRTTTLVTVRNPAPAMTCFVLQAQVNARGAGGVTAPGFHTAMPGETLLAFVSADGPPGAARQTAVISGAGLTWRLVKRANARSGDSEIWAATARTILRSAQITAGLANPGFDQSLTVVALEGTKGVGRAVAASGASGAPRLTLRTSAPASLVFAVGDDWDHAAPRVLATGWMMLDQWLDASAGNTFWTQYTNQPTGKAGVKVAVRVAAPTDDQWNLAAVELKGGG
jgi:hypothetical protein